ncbi:MAG: 3-deoxy-D-manno-octulosonic acid kinase [Gammaproteobacteria bacterium]|nr:3-deoxy-D-manno-octulosonic acid kinase [Gammaproteobacteria bacterium]MDH4253676.1 3-deoxy-D-manno-octulosonic acid kinase [Gammaproteobacteria bacterium]MDH5311331.1 3-deoxy-D-manno-octulosonic acid kinase [Gammaproteobacteria bacterium]
MTEAVEKTGNGAILYDTDLLDHVSERTFSASAWKTVKPVESALRSGGRGYTIIVGDGKREFVLRHFRRGGLVGRVIRDSYVWRGEDLTRSFSEWRLLRKMLRLGLPVPQPVVARYCRRGPFYSADLIMLRIQGIKPLSMRLAELRRDAGYWQSVGAGIARFHRAGVNHADLNAYNVQLEEDGKLWLLDFDKGRIEAAGAWQQRNLGRLHRSLQKVRKLDPRIYFTPDDWEALLEGYFQASRSA